MLGEGIGFGVRESVSDIAHNLDRWIDGIVIRTFDQTVVDELHDPRARVFGFQRQVCAPLVFHPLHLISAESAFGHRAGLLLQRGDRYLVLRYEDFVRAPQQGLERVCRFIGIDCLPELFNPTRGGRQWQGNSSFHSGFSGISADSVDTWKKELTEAEVWWIERHCWRGMQIAGYPLQTGGKFTLTRWLRRLPGELARKAEN